ncbi:MAG: acyltransferase family protein [Myxococcales bacterium]
MATSAVIIGNPSARSGAGTALSIPSLDGIRALSFAIVFVSHAGLEAVVPGGFGVTVFFFLSGYLITTLLRKEWQEHDTISFRAFYFRRVLRILPPFYIVLLVAISLTLANLLPGELRTSSVAAQALHFANYWMAARGSDGFPPGTGVYWSLAVEEHFYLLFPGFYYLLRRVGLSSRRQAHVFWMVCGLVLLWRAVVAFSFENPALWTFVATDCRLDSILFGCAMAVYNNPFLDPMRSDTAERQRRIWLPLALVGLLVSMVWRDPTFRATLRYTLQGVCLYPVFVVAIRYPNWKWIRWLNLGWLRQIGAMSYSLYLVHQILLVAVEYRLPTLSPLVRAALAFALAMLFSQALLVLVEKPCANLRRSWLRKPVPAA